jgi:hypothetical protein
VASNSVGRLCQRGREVKAKISVAPVLPIRDWKADMQLYSRSPASKCEDELQASASEGAPCVWSNMRSVRSRWVKSRSRRDWSARGQRAWIPVTQLMGTRWTEWECFQRGRTAMRGGALYAGAAGARGFCWTALTPLRCGVDGGVAEVARRDLSGTALTGKVCFSSNKKNRAQQRISTGRRRPFCKIGGG